MRVLCSASVIAVAISCPAWGQAEPSATRLLTHSKITLTKAAVETGRLVVEGTTATANTPVKLNGLYSATSNAQKKFTFSVVWLPPACIVDLTTGSGTDQAVVAMCGPKGLEFRSTWLSATNYTTNDLVTLDGSTWRAKRASKGKRPGQSAADWEVFAAKGTAGSGGIAGATGVHVSRKVCDDTGGWGVSGDRVYCVAQCAPGELAVSGGTGSYVMRETNQSHVFSPTLTIGPLGGLVASNVHFIVQEDALLSPTGTPASESMKRSTMTLICAAP